LIEESHVVPPVVILVIDDLEVRPLIHAGYLEDIECLRGLQAGALAIYSAARTVIAEDVTVPRDRLSEFMVKLDRISPKTGFAIVLIGHAGDGNIHPSVFTNSREKQDLDRLQDTLTDIFEAALELGGTLSGEHGIGLEKKRLLAKAIDPRAIEIMKAIKNVLDPNDIMNPDKIWERA
jgi:glycolate oxidase